MKHVVGASQYDNIQIVEEGPVKSLNKKQQILDDIIRGFIVIISSAIYALAVAWFLEPAKLVSIGMTALGQIFNRIFLLAGVNIPVGVFTIVFNIPLIVVGIKYVSKRFIIYTSISVVVMSLLLMGWIPVPDFLTELTKGAQNATSAFNSNTLFLSILGGLFGGVGIGLAFRVGGSTGGVDVIAQALKLRKNISISGFSVTVNILLAIIGGGIIEHDWAITFCTFIFIILLYVVVDKLHTGYNAVRIDIITKYQDEMSEALIKGIGRGVSILDVKGAYTLESKYDIFTVISYYELDKAKKIIHDVDPEAFITVIPVKRIIGAFFRHTIT